MRYVQSLLLALLLAVVVAPAGMAGSASASTVLCAKSPVVEGEELICPTGATLSEAELSLENEGPVTFSASGEEPVSCAQATASSILQHIGTKVEGSLFEVSFAECTGSAGICTVTEVLPGGTGSYGTDVNATRTTQPEGDVTIQNFEITLVLNCMGLPVTCGYGPQNVGGSLDNSTEQIKVSASLSGKQTNNILCPPAYTFSGTLNYFRSGGTARIANK